MRESLHDSERGLPKLNTGVTIWEILSRSMIKTTDELSEKLSWEEVRIKASLLGIPAWRLAEELVMHDRDGELTLSTSKVQ